MAEMKLVGVHPSGERVDITVELGFPHTADSGIALCSAAVRGLDASEFRDVAGQDKFQALSFAHSLVRARLASFINHGGRLYHADGKTEFNFRGTFHVDPKP